MSESSPRVWESNTRPRVIPRLWSGASRRHATLVHVPLETCDGRRWSEASEPESQ